MSKQHRKVVKRARRKRYKARLRARARADKIARKRT